jgi:hypothetical protein
MIHKFTFLENLLLRADIIPHPIIDSLTYTVAARVLQVSVKLGIFEILSKEDLTSEQISKNAKLSEEGAKILLETLVASGYLEQKAGKFSLTKRAKKFLLMDSPLRMKNIVLFTDYVFGELNNLEQTVKSGGPKNVNLDVFSEKQWEVFNDAMEEIGRSNMKNVIKMIPFPKEAKKLLDIGGSHGLHSIEACKRLPGLYATILDLKPVEKLAQRTIKSYGMARRVDFKVGSFFNKEDIGHGYDVVFAFNIIHGLNSEKNKRLTKEIFNSLNPSGIYVVMDQIKEARGSSQLTKLVATTMGVMLFNQAGGRTYSYNEVHHWMTEAGFKSTKLKRMRDPGSALIIGVK